MLNQMRGSLRNVIMLILIVPLVLAFALWGVSDFFSGGGLRGAIEVGDTIISEREVQREIVNAARQISRQTNGAISEGEAREFITRDQIVTPLVQRALLAEESQRLGLGVTKEMLDRAILEVPAFVNDITGEYDAERARRLLADNQMTEVEFGQTVRSGLIRAQLFGAIIAGPVVAPSMAEALFLRQAERRVVTYLTIKPDNVDAVPAPSEEDLAAYHAENAVRYSAPEYRKAVVALFRREDLLGGIEAPEEELRELYEFRKALYETPETRTVRIATFADEAAARAAAERLGAGESFETVAGDAVVTRENVEQGDILDPKIGEAAFSVETGAATEPIDGAFAWSIARVDAITPATVTPYEDVREALKAEYVADDAEVALYDLIDAFEAARDGGAGVREAAAAAGVDVIEIAAVDAQGLTPDGAPVENVPSAALEEIFTLPLDEISDMTDLNRDGDAFVVVSEDATPSTLRPLEQVRQTVEADWRSDRQEALLRAAAETMVEAARASGGLVKATEAQDRTVLSKTVNRATFDEAFSASFLNQIFNAATGDIAFAPARLGDSFVVAEIAGIVPPSLVGAEAEIARIAEEISNDNGAALIDTYLTALQADYTVRVNQQQLSILFPNEN